MTDESRPKNWRELPLGGVIPEAGNSAAYETGTWRTWRPVWTAENCVHCLTCWVFCPEEAIRLTDRDGPGSPRKVIEGIDLFHCKGCGLCVRECPVNRKGRKRALHMEKEMR